MKRQDGWDRLTLDDAVEALRRDEAAPAEAAAAAARVRERLAARPARPGSPGEAIRGCADVLALLGAYQRGELPAARALLVEDHLHECAACRAASRRPGATPLTILPWRPAAPAARPRPRRLPFAAAAAVLLAAGLAAWGAHRVFFSVPAGSRAAVQSVSGTLLRVASGHAAALPPGAELLEAEAVRTGRDSRAVLRLHDGSAVEMGERAELSVTRSGQDTSIHLSRGSIIVRAAPRRTGRLLVASSDCTVAVTGTVFSVNRGIKGSRVSVLEGRVRVRQGAQQSDLEAGQQWASPSVGAAPLHEEIAWSGELDRHLALLAEVRALREKWRAVPTPGLRYESRLLGRMPATTVVYASLPNYGQALGEAHRLFEQQLGERALLREWWQQVEAAGRGGPRLEQIVRKVQGFAEFLGDEVALVVLETGGRRAAHPLLVAEVRREGLGEYLAREFSGLDRDLRPAVAIRSGLVLLAADPLSLQAFGDEGGLEQTAFGERIAEAYRGGAGLLFAADLERVTAAAAGRRGGRHPEVGETLHRAGLDTLRHLVVERKDVGEQAHTQAVLGFRGPARGIPSWLGAPAPMGALDFVSPHAQAVAAFVSKSPALVFDDIVGLLSASGPRPGAELAELEARLDVRFRGDLAETLGGEFALALDGPLLPTPAWKLVAEVHDPARLQQTLHLLVDRANDEAAREGRPGHRLEAEDVGGRTFYAVRGRLPVELHYAYVEGYLVMAPTRALVMKAIRTRETGETLSRSAAFRALFPPDGDAHVSGVVYQNTGPMVASLVEAPGAAQLPPERQRQLAELARDARASLVCAYGEQDRIRVTGMGGIFDLDMGDLALPMLLERLRPGTARQAAP